MNIFPQPTGGGGGAVDSVNTHTGVVVLTSSDVGAEPVDATILKSAAIGVSVEGYDATILKGSDIGFSVQGYDATTLKSANIGVTVQGYDASTLKSSAIGLTVQAYDADLTSWAGIAPSAKQDALSSTVNIKSINGTSILGVGDLAVGGSAAWGGISGTLSSQTDLQSALNAKQATLVSTTNIKTINGTTILGAGNLVVTGSGSPMMTATIDMGVTPVNNATITVTDASISATSYIQVFVMGDTTVDNDLDAHLHAGASWKFIPVPAAGSFTLYIDALIDLCWGTFKIRYTYA